MFERIAPAKINLYLHILNRRAGGYHALESLVAFADCGDRLGLDLSRPFALKITGPFARKCGEAEQNSVLKAARALQLRLPELQLGAFTLEKNLPVAAGLGGGSADAAATLRLLAEANNIREDDQLIADAALYVGADVPVCLRAQPAFMRGIGEEVTPVTLPHCAAVLVNCGKPLLTREVFAKLDLREKQSQDLGAPPQDFTALVALLKTKTNDLAEAARALCPEIKQVEQAVQETGAALTRLSGSGATVFGLYRDKSQAENAAQLLRQNHPQWWVKAAALNAL